MTQNLPIALNLFEEEMKKASLLVLICLLTACSNPKDIVLGPEPLKTLEANGDSIKKLSEEERKLLVSYLMANELLVKLAGKDGATSVVGLTVGETLSKAADWKKKQEERAAEEKKRQEEAAALKAKIDEEKKQIAEKISTVVTVTVTGKRVLPEDMYARRFEDELLINYAIENKGSKDIRLIKGKMYFYDAAGDELGWLPLTFQEKIGAGKTVKTDTGRVWRIRDYGSSDIKKISRASSDGMTSKFSAESISFADGEVIKAPD